MSSPTGPGDTPPSASAAGTGAFRFGRFELHPDRHELLRDGIPVELQPKVLGFIAYLVANRGRVVDKNELLDAVWPRQVVTEAALSRCVMKARRALDDEDGGSRVIITVHGRGYRFAASVEPLLERRATARDPSLDPAPGEPPDAVDALADDASTEVIPADPPPTDAPAPGAESMESAAPASPPHWRRAAARVLAITLVVLAAWMLWQGWSPPESTAPAGTAVRVAVMPIANGTGDARHDWASIGLMSALSDVMGARVGVVDSAELVPLDAVLKALPPSERLARLQAAFGATHLIEGRLDRRGGRWRLDYRLVGPNGEDRPRTVVAPDIPALARAAAADASARLGGRGGSAAVEEDSFANEAYLRGMALRLQGDYAGAQKYFDLAHEQAPDAFWPRLYRAIGHRDLGDAPLARSELEALVASFGDEVSREALAARSALGVVLWRLGDNAAAEPALQSALGMAISLGDADAEANTLLRLGILHTYADDYDQAHDDFRRSAEASLRAGLTRPSPNWQQSMGQLAIREGDVGRAGEHVEQALAQFRQLGDRHGESTALNSLANLRRREGRFEEARGLALSNIELHRQLGNRRGEASALTSLAVAEAQLGHLKQARELARQALQISEDIGERPSGTTAASLIGQFSLDLGDYEEARTWLRLARDRYLTENDLLDAQRQRLWLARVSQAEGDLARAERQAEGLLAELGNDRDRLIRMDTLRVLGTIKLDQGSAAAALARFRESRAIAADLGDPRRLEQVDVRIAEALVATGDLAEAGRLLQLTEPRLGREPLWLQVRAALHAARGEVREALDRELAARAAAGERWTIQDEERLARRRSAARP